MPVFFAAGGMRIDPRLIDLGVLQAAAFFTILLVAVGVLSGLVSSRVRGITTSEARTIGALLNCRGLMLIATTLMTGPLLAWADHGGLVLRRTVPGR